MTSLNLRQKARELLLFNRPARLYRSIIKEVPRVMEIYDILHMGVPTVRKAIRSHFYHHKDVKDQRVVAMLVEKGYMDLEDTLLQHKQKAQLMILLEGPTQTDQNHKLLNENSTIDEQFTRWIT